MIPYVYLIGWKSLDTWYCGVRYRKGCHPSDLWKTYFTSSSHVKKFRELHGEPDHIEILKEFEDFREALLFEEQKLREFDVLNKDNWLNRNINGNYHFNHLGCNHSEETKKKISKANKGRIFTKEHKMNLMGPKSEEAKRKMSESKKGKPSNMKGKKQSKETIEKRIATFKANRLKNYDTSFS